MEQSPSCKANRFSSSQEIPRILWNPKVHYRIHKWLPPFSILCQLDPVHTPTPRFLEIHLFISVTNVIYSEMLFNLTDICIIVYVKCYYLPSLYCLETWYIRAFFHGSATPSEPRSPHFLGFTITLRRITFGRTPLDEWSAQPRDLHLTTQIITMRQISTHPVGFKPAIPASEQPHTHALNPGTPGIS